YKVVADGQALRERIGSAHSVVENQLAVHLPRVLRIEVQHSGHRVVVQKLRDLCVRIQISQLRVGVGKVGISRVVGTLGEVKRADAIVVRLQVGVLFEVDTVLEGVRLPYPRQAIARGDVVHDVRERKARIPAVGGSIGHAVGYVRKQVQWIHARIEGGKVEP